MFTAIREARRDESGAAMITALLFVIVMLFLISSISVTAISGLQKAKESQESTNLTMVVDSAVSNAISVANNPAPTGPSTTRDIGDYEGLSKAVYGVSNSSPDPANEEGKYKWLWYVEGIQDAVVGESYDIIAIAYKNEYTDVNAKRVRVRLQALPVITAQYGLTGKVFYDPIPMGAFSYGFLGTNGVTLNDGATVRSYNSAIVASGNPLPTDDTRIGTVSSNMNIAINGTNPNAVSRAVLLDGSSTNIPYDRCTTAANCEGKIESFAYGINVVSISNMVIEKCPLNASQYPDWRASLRGGVIDPSTQGNCFNNVIFDANTEVANGYGSGKPAEMYIAGNLTVNPGVEVNQNPLRKGPLTLRIYSAAGSIAKFNSGNSATDPTIFSGMVAGHNFACSDSGVAAEAGKVLIFKGSLACNTVSFSGGTQAWWDQQTVQAVGAGKDRNIQTIWSPTTYDAQYNG